MPLLPYNIVPSRAERTYITAETTFGTYVTASNSTACRSIRCALTPNIPLMNRTDKTGSLSQTVGIKGRIYGTFEIEMDLVGNGTAGNAPDCNLLLAASFGQLGAPSPTVSISAAAPSSSLLSCTVSSTATMQSGQSWNITGITGTNFVAGAYFVTVTGTTTFTIILAAGAASGTYTVSSAAASITGILYTASDASYTFDLWSFRNINGASTTNLEQRVAGSCVVTTLELSFGGDFATLKASGDCLCILDSNYFSTASTAEKGGLGSFPAEPSAPVTNGYPAPGFVGVATMDYISGALSTATIAEIKTGTITINTGRRLIRDSFGSYVPTGIEAAERVITIAMQTDDSDSAWLADLKTKSKTKVPITYSILIGSVAGNIFQVTGSNLVLNPPALEDQSIRYQARFPAARCYSSTYSTKDELSIAAV